MVGGRYGGTAILVPLKNGFELTKLSRHDTKYIAYLILGGKIMSLQPRTQDNLFGANITMWKILPKDDPMAVFSKEIYPIFSNEDFKDCYSKVGRGAKSPSFLSMVTLLQYREHVSDVEATEACVRRIDWKIALHLPLDAKDMFESSTLCRFRNAAHLRARSGQTSRS